MKFSMKVNGVEYSNCVLATDFYGHDKNPLKDDVKISVYQDTGTKLKKICDVTEDRRHMPSMHAAFKKGTILEEMKKIGLVQKVAGYCRNIPICKIDVSVLQKYLAGGLFK